MIGAAFIIHRVQTKKIMIKYVKENVGVINIICELDLSNLPRGLHLARERRKTVKILEKRLRQFRTMSNKTSGKFELARITELMSTVGLLEFKLVNDKTGIRDILDSEGQVDSSKIPPGYEVLPGRGETLYLVKEQPEITGAALINTQLKIGGRYNMPYLAVDFNKEGSKKFAKITEVNIERNLAIVLDGRVQSAPVIKSKISDGHAIIEGNFTMEEAKNLAIILNSGSLPVPIKSIECKAK